MSDATTQSTSVYLYYDSRDVLLYVGITARSVTRNREHNRDKQWWRYVAQQEVEHFPTRLEASRRETELISLHRPPFNTAQNPDAEGARAAYLSFVNSMAARREPIRIAKSLGNKLPLTPLQAGPDHRQWIFRTEMEHVNLARELGLDGPLLITAVDGFPLGRLLSVERHGAYAIFSFQTKKRQPPMNCWLGEVRFVQRPGDEVGSSFFVIRRVLLHTSRIPVARKRRMPDTGQAA